MRILKAILSIYFVFLVSCNPKGKKEYYVSRNGSTEPIAISDKEVTHLKLNIYKYKETLYLGSNYFQKRAGGESEYTMINEKIGVYLHKYAGAQSVHSLIDKASYKEIIKDLLYSDKRNVYVFPKGNGCYLCFWTLDLNPKEIQVLENTYVKDSRKVYCLIDGKEIEMADAVKFNTYITEKKYILGYDDENIYHSCEVIEKDSLKQYFDISEKENNYLDKIIKEK